MTHAGDLAEALADRYEVAGPLGAGGMASVYRALDRKRDNLVSRIAPHPEYQSVLREIEVRWRAALGTAP